MRSSGKKESTLKTYNSNSKKYLLNLNKKYVSQSPNKTTSNAIKGTGSNGRRTSSPSYHSKSINTSWAEKQNLSNGGHKEHKNSFTAKRGSLPFDEKHTEHLWDTKADQTDQKTSLQKSSNFRDHHRSMESLEKYHSTPRVRASFAEFKNNVHTRSKENIETSEIKKQSKI